MVVRVEDNGTFHGYKKDPYHVLWIENYVGKTRMKVAYKVKSLLHYEQSAFQEISVVETKGFGRMLVLDGIPQVSTNEGFIYNEMISHIPIVTHPDPKNVGMIGGGDCGHAREAMKYKSIEKIDVVEIDERVTSVCRKWLTPEEDFKSDKQFQMIHQDGYEWIQKQKNSYDVLMIDRPDPVGPGKKLFSSDFYQYVYDALSEDGVVTFQSGSPFYNESILKKTRYKLKKLFPIVRTYILTIPLFPCGIWSFTMASKKPDPLEADLTKLMDKDTNYINPEIFTSSFTLPNYIRNML
ncbi:spermidine synthase [Alkalihalobacillus macyae]|uniref:Polyamine aminopropyltransferase n=1 Tax=Guptibacillus hwajinpoensis TaxID=208199 RepID=A0A0J6CUX9_9BACL|nr:spermidine synthase [Alkalihalobacillus macyae]